MKMAFEHGWRPRGRNKELLATLLEVVEDLQGQGFRLTLRQLFYQLVSRDAIANSEKTYKALGTLVKKARLAGALDWDAIEDRGRRVRSRLTHDSPADAIRFKASTYRRDRLEGQDRVVEAWVEKEALMGVLTGVCDEYGVGLLAAKGYSSVTVFWDFRSRMLHDDRTPVILYLGDHDPSGVDMTRDVQERATLLHGRAVTVDRLALNPDHITAYDLIPNPAKVADSRAEAYIAQYGEDCYELDALPPAALIQILRDGIERYVDKTTYRGVRALERADRSEMLRIADEYDDEND